MAADEQLVQCWQDSCDSQGNSHKWKEDEALAFLGEVDGSKYGELAGFSQEEMQCRFAVLYTFNKCLSKCAGLINTSESSDVKSMANLLNGMVPVIFRESKVRRCSPSAAAAASLCCSYS